MTDWDPSQLLRGLSQASNRMASGAAQGVGEWAEHVLGEATRIVPLAQDGGTLQNSGMVAQSADGLTAGVGYGSGAAAPYAVAQHERLDYVHTYPDRQAKYLEIPLMASRITGPQIVAEAIRRNLK